MLKYRFQSHVIGYLDIVFQILSHDFRTKNLESGLLHERALRAFVRNRIENKQKC